MEHYELLTVKHLANYLNVTEEFIVRLISDEYQVKDPHSNEKKPITVDIGEVQCWNISTDSMEIDKVYLKKKSKRKELRVVYSPNQNGLGNLLKILNNKLSSIYQANDCVHGYVKGRSIKTNAKQHLGKKYILSIDIENFFDSINSEMIKSSLIELEFIPEVADWISKITTLNGYLVQGFHTSPTMANIVAQDMDDKFVGICGDDITYTRYADDLYFSSDLELPDVAILEDILNRFSFRINEKKTSLMKRGRKQYVTGLTVFDNKTPRIPKMIKKNIRLEVYHICKYGYQNHAIRQLHNSGVDITENEFSSKISQQIIEIQHRLFGWLHYIHSIEPRFAESQISKLKLASRYIDLRPRK